MTRVTNRFAAVILPALVAAGVIGHAAPSPQRHKLPTSHVGAPRSAQTPQPAAQIEVLLVNGTNGTGGIGPGLENLPQLTRPPFSAYSQLTLVSRSSQTLGTSPATVSIPNGNSAVITSPGRQANGRYQVNVQLTINGHTHGVQFAAAPGDPFFTAETTGPNSALILGFIIH